MSDRIKTGTIQYHRNGVSGEPFYSVQFMWGKDAQCHHGGQLIQNPGRFYRLLQSIQYNLVSNGGQCMLCREDMERLDNLIAVLANEMIGEYQRGQVKA